jgi:hypothetical protein
VPDIVIAQPPAVRVVPVMEIPVGLAVRVWPPSVKTLVGPVPGKDAGPADEGCDVGIGTMEVPITSPLEP